MVKQRVTFGACFLTLATAAALLFTWTIWWMAVVGSSVPARRPFYSKEDQVPELIQQAAKIETSTVFEYSLRGGWPSANSSMRLLASLIAVFASLSFAYVAAFLPDRATRLIFSVVLAAVAVLGFISLVLDARSIAITRSECKSQLCVTAVPQAVLASGNLCRCSPDPWFYLTVVIDALLTISAIACLLMSVVPIARSRAVLRPEDVSGAPPATGDLYAMDTAPGTPSW